EARDVTCSGHGDVTEVPGRALFPTAKFAVNDQAGADAGGDLDEDEVLDVRPMRMMLAQRHDIHIVVNEDRSRESALEIAWHVETVPSGHDRRADRATDVVLDGPGQADAHADDVLQRPSVLLEHRQERIRHP